MRDWLSSLSSDRVPEVAVALALGYAFVTLVDTFVRVPVSVLAQRVGDDPYDEDDSVFGLVDLVSEPYSLNFSIGKTVVAYGPVLVAVLALGLVALVGVLVTRRRDRVLGECPFCASRIPYESTHCAYCGSGVAPGEPVDT
jgi:large-conductance mechanosensitive channel